VTDGPGSAPVAPARLRVRRRWPWSPSLGTGQTWTVHATVDEPTELLCAFVAHYKALGATQIWLALDRPRAEQIAILGSVPGVRLTLCTRGYWLRHRGYRPALHVSRQYVNATHAYRQAKTDWFLECDADEFLLPSRPMNEVLGATPAKVPFLRLPMAERVFEQESPPITIFDGRFRTPLRNRPRLLRHIYGDLVSMVPAGMTGHSVGKSITRTGLSAWIWLHTPIPPFTKPSRPEVQAMVKAAGFTDSARLLHFDGMTPFHWRLKLMRKLLVGRSGVSNALRHNTRKRGEGREKQIAAVFEARMNARAMDRLDALQMLSPEALARLHDAGTILPDGPDLIGQATALFPDVPLDFSASHFDAQLAILYADSIATLGLSPGPSAPA
jgi:hypothetical protein